MSNKITFSHKYPKFGNATSAKLVKVELELMSRLSPEFLEYDTAFYDTKSGFEHYDLSKYKEVIILYFLTEGKTLFTTIRRYIPHKFEYYRSKIGQVFEIVIKEKEI